MKTCTKCGAVKDDHDFGKRKGGDGLVAWCKCCKKEYNAAWHAANPDYAKKTSLEWRTKNQERYVEYSAEHREKNKSKLYAATAKWRKENVEKVRAYNAKWTKENLQLKLIHNHNRRCKMITSGKLSFEVSEKLFKLQRGKCACGCKQPLGDDYHLDHIMPVALGGSNTDDNIQLLRATCNLQKQAKHPVDFMRQRGFLL